MAIGKAGAKGGFGHSGAVLGGAGGLPAPPVGWFYLIDTDGAYIVDTDGAYILTQ